MHRALHVFVLRRGIETQGLSGSETKSGACVRQAPLFVCPLTGTNSVMKRHNGLIVIVGLVLLAGAPLLSEVPNAVLWQVVQTFVTIFLGIFIEAIPFLLAGAVVSGLISEFVQPAWVSRLTPRHPLLTVLAGVLLGMVFPVCECGVVPVTRRLYQKGVPLGMGVSFLLAAPVLNPVVIASTWAAYGWSVMFWARMVAALLIALLVGALFHYAKPETVLRAEHVTCSSCMPLDVSSSEAPIVAGRAQRLWHAPSLGGDEFLEMAQYLVIGCLLAAGMQTLVPKATLLAWGDASFKARQLQLHLFCYGSCDHFIQ